MVVPSAAQLQAFAGGQMTDLPDFTGTFDGTELFEVVAPGNVALGINYSITSALLAGLLLPLTSAQVVISQGQYATAGSPYSVPASVARIYVNKPIAEPTYIKFGNASAQLADVLVKDVAGTTDGAGNGIFTTVTTDGIVNPTITVPYGGFFFRPVNSLNTWTLGTS